MIEPRRASGWQTAALLVVWLTAATTTGGEPRVADDRYQLELVASDPDIVTPIGMTFDRQGRLLVVESHTHKRMDDYQGPPGDRVRMFADSDGDGRLDQWSTYAGGLRHAMNLLARPDGGLYVLARHNVELHIDDDGDGRADQSREIIHLESEDDYPHNGLGGIAAMPDGSLVLALGENHGFAYRLTGADGTVITGDGGTDGILRATADGANLRWWAQGVWNPFSVCVDPHGRIFAVDNDPDASPPCRLLHVVPGGDYGYLFQYGRAGTHPLQAWNGELPGTLPMVCGVGEAPTAIVPHAGRLWVTSWGDHRIESYRLIPSGGSFTAEREVVVQGDADFRPTGMAVGPDGAIYFGDWVRREYEVHRRGRIWRLTLPAHELGDGFPAITPEHDRLAALEEDDIDITLGSDKPFVHAAGVWALSQAQEFPDEVLSSPHPRVRLGYLEALRWNQPADPTEVLREALADQSADVRLYAVRWIADQRILALRDEVAALLEEPPANAQYYLALLGAVDWLDHDPKLRHSRIADGLLARELRNPHRSAEIHALALRLIEPDHQWLTSRRLRRFLRSEHVPLRLEAVRTLAQQSDPQRFPLLAEVASDTSQADAIRAEAIMGLAAASERHRPLLEELAASQRETLRREADRALRLTHLRPSPDDAKPASEDLSEWIELLSAADEATEADIESGRRLFFSPVGPRCASCHRHSGRGGTIGPDLTHIGRISTRERIISSVIQPSLEIAPHYQPWLLVTDDGKSRTGLRMAKGGDDGVEKYADEDGNLFTLRSDEIESRSASPTSIMPDALESTVSIGDLRDLIAFLIASDEPQ